MNQLLIFTLFFWLPLFAFADTEHTNGQWTGFFVRKDLDDTIGFHQEFQIRSNYESGTTAQSLFRAGPLWRLSEKAEVGLLYAFVRTGALSEHRLTEQIVYSFSEFFATRFRFEQRTLEKMNGVSLRARLLARFVWPFAEAHSVVLWNEYFLQPTRPQWIYDELFDRNRYFFGARSKFKYLTLEYGYMNQFTNRSGSDFNEHLFLIYFIL